MEPGAMFEHGFWDALDTLVRSHELVVDRPRGSRHPAYPDTVYPFDYGYLAATRSSDGAAVDVFVGPNGRDVRAVACTVDPVKRDVELKVVLGCDDVQMLELGEFLAGCSLAFFVVRRPDAS